MRPEHYAYSAAAFDFFNQLGLQSPRKRAFIEQLAGLLPPKAEVCDVGGGTGIYAEILLTLRPDITITLVEPSGSMIDIARQRLDSRVLFVHADIHTAIENLQQQDALVFIRSWYALEDNLGAYDALIGRLSSKLRPTGFLVIYSVQRPVDVDKARSYYANKCLELGMQEGFEKHWPRYQDYLQEFNSLLLAKRICVVDHLQLDSLLLDHDFKKLFLSPEVQLYRKSPPHESLTGGLKLRDFYCLGEGYETFLLNIDTSGVFRINESLRRALDDLRSRPGKVIINSGLIKVLNRLELIPPKESPPLARSPLPGIGHMMLNVAQACNLACTYCYGGEGEYGNCSLMTVENARAAVDWLMVHSEGLKRIWISFFGGEPLLNLPVMKAVVAYARAEGSKQGKEVNFTVTTNGTLLTEEIVLYLKDNRVGLHISYDGELQDRQRPFKDGRGSAEIVLQALKMAARHYRSRLNVTATVADGPIDFKGWRDQMRELNCTRVHIRRASPLLTDCRGGWCGESTNPGAKALSEELMREFGGDIEDQVRENLDLIRQRQEVVSNEFRRMLSLLLFRGKLTHYCGVGRGLVACATNGDLYPCHRFNGIPEFCMGSLADFEMQSRDRYEELTVDGIPACRECWARYLCGGGCLYDRLNNAGKTIRPQEAACTLYRRTAEAVIHLFACLNQEDKEFLRNKLGPPELDEPAALM